MGTRKKLSNKAVRRAHARVNDKIGRAREKLARHEPGGAPERPIDLVSASLVEAQARSMPCATCLGETKVNDHTAETLGGKRLRLAHVMCSQCGTRRAIYFRILSSTLN